jgi:hypothetical protein
MNLKTILKNPYKKMKPEIVWQGQDHGKLLKPEYVRVFDSTQLADLPVRMERKFYLPSQKLDLAKSLLHHLCRMDGEYPSEQINSLYFDTLDLDEYQRSLSGDHSKRKVRIRWYGKSQDNETVTAFLELKSREGFASTKQRLKLQVPTEKIFANHLCKGIIPGGLLSSVLASFGYFPTELLRPVIKITYWRYRFREILSGCSVSLDTHIRSVMVAGEIGNGENEMEFPGGVIEIKGKDIEIPLTLRNLNILEIDWTRFSKYTACLESHVEGSGVIGCLSPPGKILFDRKG